ncbi:venom carboxylesterase-6-like [Venturia canescens]|uniref:venom carboxylesterase-6-like n=1 Tax=Venturia canescens TaxID=32260 RepID=UPI001C9C2264|nr:venom carboxylesterase-6-like [Venturia canescens]
MKILVEILLITIIGALADERVSPRVQTPLGKVRGYWDLSRDGRKFEAYEGIPYAQPPIGELRFEPPEPIGAWTGELPATKPSSVCLQYLHLVTDPNDRVTGAEDCLYLNVYTPNSKITDRKESMPVIVYIHSGAFQFGDGATHRPHYLMDHDVVLVTLNYRLGPLGFLSTRDEIVPGNMGLKDQTLALAWVAKNIVAFGGDPDSVTITGLSAGAASVHYHYLSPTSRGLFHRGMSVSGTALDCWTQTEASREKAKKLGATMGCPTNNNEEMIRCLKTRPAKSIFETEGEFMGWLYNPFTPFGPVVENHSAKPFIDKSPIDAIESGEAADLPWITGVVTEEGLYPGAEFVADDELMKQLDENWDTVAPFLLDYNYTIPLEEHADLARKIRKHYLGEKRIDRTTVNDVIRMIGDRQFVVDAENAARRMAAANDKPVRFYRFSYRGEHSLSDAFTGNKKNYGVSHADDLAYVFTAWNSALTEEKDLQMSREMVNFWTSYAKTGIPEVGIHWMQVDGSDKDFEYLMISGPGKMGMETSANLGDKKFWSRINFDENRPSGTSGVKRRDKGEGNEASSEKHENGKSGNDRVDGGATCHL